MPHLYKKYKQKGICYSIFHSYSYNYTHAYKPGDYTMSMYSSARNLIQNYCENNVNRACTSDQV